MIASITEWIKDIVFVVLFAAFLDLLLPSGSMQKFVRVIVGLFIMLTVLNPVIDFMDQTASTAETTIFTPSYRADASSVTGLSRDVLQKRNGILRDYYAKDLAKQIQATALSVEGVADAKVDVILGDMLPANPSIPAIKTVNIVVSPRLNTAELHSRPAISTSPAIQEKVKHTVSGLYHIKAEDIEIKILP